MGKKANKAHFTSSKNRDALDGSREVPSQQSVYTTDNSAAETTQLLWKALKKEDVAHLTSLLFQQNGASHSPASLSRSPPIPNARQILSQCGVKKMLPLVYAAQEGLSPSCITLLLQAGAPINMVDETPSRHSALHAACWNEDESLIPLLLCAGADLRVKDWEGRTPLHVLASSSSAVSVMKYILNFVKFPSSTGFSQHVPNNEDFEEVDFNTCPNENGVKKLALDPLDLLAIQDEYGMTPVHIAFGEVAQRKPAFMAIYLLSFLEKEWSREVAKKETEEGESNASLSPRQERIKKLISLCTKDSSTLMHILFSGQSDDREVGEVQTMLNLLNIMLKFNTAHLVRAFSVRGETPLHSALYALGELSSAKVEEIAKQMFCVLFEALLNTPLEISVIGEDSSPVSRTGSPSTSTESFDSLIKVLCTPNDEGIMWVHVAITQHCSPALSALQTVLASFPFGNEALSSKAKERCCTALRDLKTADGETTSEIFASELAVYSRYSDRGARGGTSLSVLMKMKETLIQLGVVERVELEELVLLFREMEDEEDEEEENEGGSPGDRSTKSMPGEGMLPLVTTGNSGKKERMLSVKHELSGAYSSRIQRARKGRALRVNNAKKERELLKEEEKISENESGERSGKMVPPAGRKRINAGSSSRATGKKESANSEKTKSKDSATSIPSTSDKAELQAVEGGIFQSAYILMILLLFLATGIALSWWS